ncbi:spidroin-2-like [Manis pentadactyla]|uniref:spidroin-2-like n=1 Tax=Manis pentadactyla TaxID=143292 RepID=UPI00255C2A50|nr:spidroin-2-like [Manis pentadactyla]
MVGEGAFPAAAPSAAIGLVAFWDELSRIGFQLQPPGRQRKRGAGSGGGGGGRGEAAAAAASRADRGGRRAPRTKAPGPWGGRWEHRSPGPASSASHRCVHPGRGGKGRAPQQPAAEARPVSPELWTRRPPRRARSFGTAGARALARPRDPRRKAPPHSHPTSRALPPRRSANFPKNAPTPGHPAGRAPGAGEQASISGGRAGAPEWAAATDVSPRSPGPASAGSSSGAGARPPVYGAWAPAPAQ